MRETENYLVHLDFESTLRLKDLVGWNVEAPKHCNMMFSGSTEQFAIITHHEILVEYQGEVSIS